MRIVFLGTPDFAAHSLEKLHQAGKEIVGIVTAPDRKAGRGQQLKASPVKEYALKHNLNCLQPTNLKDPNFLKELASLKADLQIVVAFRMLPEVVWNMPALGTMNLHASLLPSYRGAAPINWAIINGEKKTGVTTFFLKHEIDTGEILLQKEVQISDQETAGTLHDKLMKEGAELLLESTGLVEKGNFSTIPQIDLIEDSKKLSDLPNAPKIFREDCKINWNEMIESIDCFIRGLSPYPASWTYLTRKKDQKKLVLKIYEVQLMSAEKINAGRIKEENGKLFIDGMNGRLIIEELQLEGKKRMRTTDFLNGVNLEDYEEILS